MSRNILELKSIKIAPEKVQTLAAAKRIAKLKDFDLKEEYFEMVCHPADLVNNIAYYVIGMDIITMGDFCISNYGNNTVMTFRFPSLETIDYCKEVNDLNRYQKIHEINLKKNLPDNCGCGSGKLYKNCHGMSTYNKV